MLQKQTNIKHRRTQETHTETPNGKLLRWWIIPSYKSPSYTPEKKLLPVVDFGRRTTVF